MHPAVGSSNKNSMWVSRNASILLERSLLLSRRFGPMILIILASITALTLSFHISQTNNGASYHGARRQSNFGVNDRIRQTGWASSPSSSPSISSLSYRIPLETLLYLSADPTPSYSHFTAQQRSPGIGTEVNSRDMTSLSDWSRSCEIVLADGVELTEDLLGDWSLTTTKSIEQGSSIMTVPSQVILTSDVDGDSYLPHYSETDMQNVRVWMESELKSGPQSKQDYLPEYMLVFKLIREVYMEKNSPWHTWLQSLPTQFSTGLYLDEVERNHVERMTGEHILVQNLQYKECLELFQKMVSFQESGGKEALIPTKFLEWMLALQQDSNKEDARFDNLIKWAFTIVFTRSWRSPDRSQAQIVPLGDLANHDSQFANLMPGFRQTDGAFQFFVTTDIDVVAGPTTSPRLYLSYGLTYHPARYLVVFGFCDVTAAYIDAQLDFLQDNVDCKWPTTLDPSQLVVSTLNGALSEEVWMAFLFKILEEDDPELLAEIRDAYDDNEDHGDQLVEEVLETKEFTVGMEIQAYYQRLLQTDFVPIPVTEKDLSEHPNLSMIVNYNLFIRETYLNVLEHVITFLTQCTEFEELSTSQSKNELDSVTPSKESSTLYSEFKSPKGSNQTSISSRSDSVSQKSESKSSRSVPTQFSSSEPSSKDSVDKERDNNVFSNKTAQTVQKNILSNAISSFSTENLDRQSYSVQESQEIIELNTTAELKGTTKINRLSYSKDNNVAQEGSNSSSSSKFSFENFSLQSYSKKNATSKSDVKSDPRSYSPDQTIPKGIDQQPTPNTPIGNFNPQFYSASRKRPTQESTDAAATSAIPYGKIESQSYPDSKPKFPNGYSDPQPDSLDQLIQEQIDYANSNSESYSNSQTMPPTTQERTDSTATSKFSKGNADPQSYSLDPQPSQEQIDYGNSNSRSYFTDTRTTLTAQERIDPTGTFRFSNGNSDLQSYSLDQTEPSQDIDQTGPSLLANDIDQTGPSLDDGIDQTAGSSQDGTVDFTTSYAQSLVSDQRGQQQQQQSDIGDIQFAKELNNQDIPSTPTTYAEYVQQREEESVAFDESETDFPI